MNKLTLVDQYSKYLVAIKREDSDVVLCFKKFSDLLDRVAKVQDMKSLVDDLYLDSIYNTILLLRKRSIKPLDCKGYSRWNREDIDKFWKLSEKFCKADSDVERGVHDNTVWNTAFAELWKHTESQPAHVRLYMYLKLSEGLKRYRNDEKYEFFATRREKVKALQTAGTEEEIEEILEEQGNATVQLSESDLEQMASEPVKVTTNKPAPASTVDGWNRWERLTADMWEMVFAIRKLKDKHNIIPDEDIKPAAERILDAFKDEWADKDTLYDKPFDFEGFFEERAYAEVNRLLGIDKAPSAEEANNTLDVMTEKFCENN